MENGRNSTTPQHTPTPWKVSDGTDTTDVQSASGVDLALMMFYGRDREGVEVEIDGKANAAMIVRAVNSHAALVDVVERMRAAHRAQLPSEARDQFGGGCGCPLCEAGRAALAAAKGTPK